VLDGSDSREIIMTIINADFGHFCKQISEITTVVVYLPQDSAFLVGQSLTFNCLPGFYADQPASSEVRVTCGANDDDSSSTGQWVSDGICIKYCKSTSLQT
jgi:hypothetical protein